MTFRELSELNRKGLARQKPVTLEQARAQVLRVKIQSSNENKEREIKYLLSMYHPEWTLEQIEAEFKRLID